MKKKHDMADQAESQVTNNIFQVLQFSYCINLPSIQCYTEYIELFSIKDRCIEHSEQMKAYRSFQSCFCVLY